MPIPTKANILEVVHEQLNAKIAMLQTAIVSVKESRDNDTKSSAGDKYETGREMMQVELDKNQVQLIKNQSLKNELSRINIVEKSKGVTFGSLVNTTQGLFFIAIGLGKINVHNKACFVISLASPIGKLLRGKRLGQKFDWNGKQYKLTEIS